jgi:glycosyltransferase involved in cell wall biosynthesis
MNVLVIPSWYPTRDHPVTGIFFRQQSLTLAKSYPELNVGISLWGSHEETLWVDRKSGIHSVIRLWKKKPNPYENALHSNCKEYYCPSLTWTRKLFRGNINGIIKANERNLKAFKSDVGQVDLIHAHVGYPAGYIARHLSGKFNIPFIITEHMSPFPFESLAKAGQPLPIVLEPILEADRIIAVNQQLASTIQQKTGRKQIDVIPNLVDESVFFPRQKAKNEVPKALFIGRLEKQKGIEYLIEALSRLDFELTLTIIGEGALKQEITELVRFHQLENVVMEGWKSQDQIAKYYQSHDFLILPSIHENNPLVLLEAMACGIPVVATLNKGSEEVVNEHNGILAESKNATDLANKIDWMTRHYLSYDQETIREIFLKNYSSRIIADKIMELYRSVLEL